MAEKVKQIQLGTAGQLVCTTTGNAYCMYRNHWGGYAIFRTPTWLPPWRTNAVWTCCGCECADLCELLSAAKNAWKVSRRRRHPKYLRTANIKPRRRRLCMGAYLCVRSSASFRIVYRVDNPTWVSCLDPAPKLSPSH